MNLFRNILHGVLNFWRFRREVWNWRGYSWEYDYDLFMRGLELTAEHIADHKRHTCWQESVTEIEITLNMYRDFLQYDYPPEDEATRWGLLHDSLKRNAQGWWD